MIAIVDYRAGNLVSVERATRKLGFPCLITSSKKEISRADHLIFPGVGAAGEAMQNLRELGLDQALMGFFSSGRPFLGICLGAQIILSRSEENETECLGLIPGEVKRFPCSGLKIPHMGWNSVSVRKAHPVLSGINPGDEFYFVHSYYPVPASEDRVIGATEHGISFPSIIGVRNIIATQFHLEKSGECGLRILGNFCRWDGHAE